VVPGRTAALCQLESGALQPEEGSACGDVIIEKSSLGAQPANTAGENTTRGETAHGETHPPTDQQMLCVEESWQANPRLWLSKSYNK